MAPKGPHSDAHIATTGGPSLTILQVLSLTLFETMPIFKLFSDTNCNLSNPENSNQLFLFE